jgi:putative glutamine amidotransferase
MQNAAYFAAVEAAGGIPLPIPPMGDPADVLALADLCDAMCLPGGKDVDPVAYGDTVRAGGELETCPELDGVEIPLVRRALERGTPLLGICRGMQILNVTLGGTLWQDLDDRPGTSTATHHGTGDDVRAATTCHPVHVTPESRLRELVGRDVIDVNSRHHQGIRVLGGGLLEAAHAPDGLVEAVEVAGHRFALGVEWHPEELGTPVARRLFEALISAASTR